MAQAFVDRQRTPAEVLDLSFAPAFTPSANDTNRSVASASTADNTIFTVPSSSGSRARRRQLLPVDDAHIHAGLDRVVEEGGVDGLAHRVVAAEEKR